MMKTNAFALALTVSMLAPLGAQTVEFVLFATGGGEAPAEARSSECLLSGALDELFARGFIATNALPRRGDEAAFLSYAPGTDSVEGAVDYALVALAAFGERAELSSCRYRLLLVPTGEELASGELKPSPPGASDRKSLDAACASLGAALVAACEAVMRGPGGLAEE